MKNIKTYEGFFDFFKKKNYDPISIRQILDCLLPITDCDSIKSPLKGDRPDGIFADRSDVVGKQSDHDQFMDDLLRRNAADTGGLEISGNISFFNLQYCPNSWNDGRYRRAGADWSGISDDEVNSIMKECQETLEGFDCQMTFFIGRGGDEGRTWNTEFSDINKMILKTIHRIEGGRVPYARDCVRNITVKIKALGGIEA
jgi:hypothetical protein